jgi:hypothetical protein
MFVVESKALSLHLPVTILENYWKNTGNPLSQAVFKL